MRIKDKVYIIYVTFSSIKKYLSYNFSNNKINNYFPKAPAAIALRAISKIPKIPPAKAFETPSGSFSTMLWTSSPKKGIPFNKPKFLRKFNFSKSTVYEKNKTY